MSELPFSDDDSDEPDRPARGRALWAFAALASAAVIIVALMVFLLGEPGGSKNDHHDRLAIPGGTSTTGAVVTGGASTPSAPTSSLPATTSHAPSSSTAATTSTAPRSSCPTTTPCVSPGDPGGVIGAINAYRRQHGAPAATATVTAEAQKCAAQQGNESACPASYSWEPVETATGAKVVQKFAARGGGDGWLLDPKTTRFAVGWAFVPDGHGTGGHYSCAIVKAR
jgi:hypothetical protein